LGWSQEELARKARVPLDAVKRIEGLIDRRVDRPMNPRTDGIALRRIAQAFKRTGVKIAGERLRWSV
jgi:hypothetical protein